MNPNNLLLSTDYPLDKVVYLKTHSVTLTSFQIQNIMIPHNLPFIPLIQGQWSNTPDFSIAYNINTELIVGINRRFDTMAQANETNINFETQNRTQSTATVYYRIFGFMPSTANENVLPTNIDSNNFVIHTDYNYMKLAYYGVTAIPGGGSYTINHGLGYYPKVMTWSNVINPEFIAPTYQSNFGGSFSFGIRADISPETLILRNDESSSKTVHYRVYADEA